MCIRDSIYSLPIALMVAELATLMPVPGGYYQWVKEGLGPFWGFQAGWWAWVASWFDLAIYPVLFLSLIHISGTSNSRVAPAVKDSQPGSPVVANAVQAPRI